MRTKSSLYTEEKVGIARLAAGLVKRRDFVYLDAGSTTLQMIDFLAEKGATYVTNGLPHASKLAGRGFKVFILGGAIKATTEAVVGSGAIRSLEAYNFTKGFFGTNGISLENGFSTPDPKEAAIKTKALYACRRSYILADESKFGVESNVRFADFKDAKVITTAAPDGEWKKQKNIIQVQ